MRTMLALRLDATYDPDAKALIVLLPDDMEADTLSFKRRAASDNGDDEQEVVFTEAELDEMLKPRTPLTGAEIAAEIEAEGGGWEGKGITDTLAWLDEQKRKRQERYRW